MIDIGANMLDAMFQGHYNGSQKHPPDLPAVLDRAWAAGLDKIIVTAGNLQESKEALELSMEHDGLSCTLGVHPTRAGDIFGPDDQDGQAYMAKLLQLAEEGLKAGKLVAVGEFGLDFDRLQFCDKETQLRGFELQFQLAAETKLPLFLHMRAAAGDFTDIIRAHRTRFSTGVVHSFTGSREEATALMAEDLYIGINGCSLKSEEQLATVRDLPLDRLMLETDAPWCEVRPTHAGFGHIKTTFPTKKKERHEVGSCVKGRQEPCHLVQVLEVVAGVKGMPVEEVAAAVRANTMKVFWPKEAEEERKESGS